MIAEPGHGRAPVAAPGQALGWRGESRCPGPAPRLRPRGPFLDPLPRLPDSCEGFRHDLRIALVKAVSGQQLNSRCTMGPRVGTGREVTGQGPPGAGDPGAEAWT